MSLNTSPPAAIGNTQSPSTRDMLSEDMNTEEDESSDNIQLVQQLANRELSNKETCV